MQTFFFRSESPKYEYQKENPLDTVTKVYALDTFKQKTGDRMENRSQFQTFKPI